MNGPYKIPNKKEDHILVLFMTFKWVQKAAIARNKISLLGVRLQFSYKTRIEIVSYLKVYRHLYLYRISRANGAESSAYRLMRELVISTKHELA